MHLSDHACSINISATSYDCMILFAKSPTIHIETWHIGMQWVAYRPCCFAVLPACTCCSTVCTTSVWICWFFTSILSMPAAVKQTSGALSTIHSPHCHYNSIWLLIGNTVCLLLAQSSQKHSYSCRECWLCKLLVGNHVSRKFLCHFSSAKQLSIFVAIQFLPKLMFLHVESKMSI